MMIRTLILFLLWVCSSSVVCAEEFYAKVIAVLDGDTVLVLREGGGTAVGNPSASHLRGTRGDNGLVKIRMAEIDAPEKDQEYGRASRQSLSELALKKLVHVNSQAVDNYGRLVAHLVVDGRSVNEEQVRRGMAWEYSNYHSNKVYIALQGEAQQARRGLWAQANNTPPWQWRKTHTIVQSPQHAAAHGYSCGSKRHCAQMSSCDEAIFYLTHCGVKLLDKNGNGVPCESLCAAKK